MAEQVRTELRLVDGTIHEIEFASDCTTRDLIAAIAKHFSLEADSWQLRLRSDSGVTYLYGEEVLGTLLAEHQNSSLCFYPEIAAG